MIPRDSKQLAGQCTARYKPANPEQSPHPQPPHLSCSHTLKHYPPALITTGPGTTQLGTVPMSQSPRKLLKLDNAKPV